MNCKLSNEKAIQLGKEAPTKIFLVGYMREGIKISL
jgi:hypothetical protein